MGNFTNKLKSYSALTDGQFAIWFALAAFPVLVATSLALDFRQADKEDNAVKQALDVSVLSAVSNDKLTQAGKISLAERVFHENYSGDMKMDFNIKVDDGRVEMTAMGQSSTTIGKAVGFDGFDVKETSVAVMNRQNTICVLALAEKGKGKLRFLNSTIFNSPTCSVQSNSNHDQGMISKTRYMPAAKSFCSAGGGEGRFTPAMRGECRVIDDPYKERSVPQPGVCMPPSIFGEKDEPEEADQPDPNPSSTPIPYASEADSSGAISLPPFLAGRLGKWANSHLGVPGVAHVTKNKHTHYHCDTNGKTCHIGKSHSVKKMHGPIVKEDRLDTVGLSPFQMNRLIADYGPDMFTQQESLNYTTDNGIYYPGTYCGGLTVDGRNVTFMPGIYIIKDGPLTFKNGTQAGADEVSFVLTGKNAVVTVESGSYVYVKAPKSGPMAGMALYQAQNNAVETPGSTTLPINNQNRLGHPNSSTGTTLPNGVNLLSSGGELNVIGTMYFPTQALEVVGDSILGAQAPATSFIAYQVTFAGKTKAEVSVDHVKADIPPMLPRSDDGARLIK